MSLRAAAHVLFRHKRKIALVMAVALAVGAALAWAVPPRYRAEATLMADARGGGGGAALAALLESADLHAAVLSGLGDRLYPGLPAARRRAAFAAALAVAPGREGLVRVRFDGSDPVLAARALEALLAGVEARNRAVFGGDGRDVDPGAERAALTARRARLDGDRVAAEAEAAAGAATVAVLRRRLEETPATIAVSRESERSRVVEEARAKLFELETREQELLGKYTEQSTFVTRVRAERRKVETLLSDLMATSDTRTTQGANPVRQSLETELFRAEAAAAKASGHARALAGQVAAIDARLSGLAGRGGRAAAVDGIGVVQTAFAPARPVGPPPAVVLALALAAGLVAALVVALLAQRLSTRFATPAEVEHGLGLPVLTTIPRES